MPRDSISRGFTKPRIRHASEGIEPADELQLMMANGKTIGIE
jgi:hypothetical protein